MMSTRDVEDVGVVVLRPSCKRHEDVQLTPQQRCQPLVFLGRVMRCFLEEHYPELVREQLGL